MLMISSLRRLFNHETRLLSCLPFIEQMPTYKVCLADVTKTGPSVRLAWTDKLEVRLHSDAIFKFPRERTCPRRHYPSSFPEFWRSGRQDAPTARRTRTLTGYNPWNAQLA